MEENKFEIVTSRNFMRWLTNQKVSLAFTTYQIGKVFMIGSNPDGKMHVTERTFSRCMGLGGDDQGFWMSSIFQIWRFQNSLLPGQSYNGYDRVFLPQTSTTTGDLDVHDLAPGKNGKPIFVNTLFSCISTTSDSHSFKPLWQPPFITKLAPEDRCHLNGMATKDGEPIYVTAVSKSDVSDGWRDHRESGGIVMDVRTNEIICENLSMPHSPRYYRDKLWLLEAGSGYFGSVDTTTGEFKRLTFCPGFLRGMAFIDNYAVVGTSSLRKNKTFSGLELDKNLKDKEASPRCSINVINLETGSLEHWIRMEGIVEEIFDVMTMPNVIRPLLVGVQKDEIKQMISIED